MADDQIKDREITATSEVSAKPDTPPEGVTILMGYDVIIFAICYALYLLLMVVSFALVFDPATFSDPEVLELAGYWSIGLIILFLIGVGVLAIFVLAIEGYPGTFREKLALKMKPLVGYAVPWFVLLTVIAFTRLLVLFTDLPLAMIALSIIFAVLSFLPLLAVKNVKDEGRIKNYIDAMARICTCLTFIGGGIVFVVKTLILID